ncbi:MAG TPA: hypothetical protein VFH63_01620 [candidate division Zixibacteria bacterium]|nr:hypothetical protein [candidate division Zixibacteria bacterium]
MFRRIVPSFVVAALVLAGCGGAGPGISDPKEIVSQGLQATGEAKSFHLLVTADGNVTVPELGGQFGLNGMQLEGDFDLESQSAQLSLSIPSFMGLTGDFILVDDTFYLRTSMTGELWTKMDGGVEQEVPTDPEEALAQMRQFLDTEGVETQKLDDVECGDTTCYAVRMTIPTEVMGGEAAQELGEDPSAIFGEELVLDLRFDRQNLWLRGLSTSIAGEGGTFDVEVTLSAFNEPVQVSPPPADQVTDELPLLPGL